MLIPDRYPFHLRPKNRQAFQYLRMVVDIVADLEIDQDPDGDGLPPGKASDERLEQVRTYLATYYLVSSSAQAWHRTSAMHYTDYTTKCCALLERDSSVKGDRVLAWLVRIYHLLQEAIALRKTRGQNEYQTSPMLRGLEAQLAEWEGRMSPELSSTRTIYSPIFLHHFTAPTSLRSDKKSQPQSASPSYSRRTSSPPRPSSESARQRPRSAPPPPPPPPPPRTRRHPSTPQQRPATRPAWRPSCRTCAPSSTGSSRCPRPS